MSLPHELEPATLAAPPKFAAADIEASRQRISKEELDDAVYYMGPEGQQHGFVLRDVLSASECADFIEAGERLGFHSLEGLYRQNYRTNWRCVVHSPAVATTLYERVRRLVPQRMVVAPGSALHKFHGPESAGVWELCGLNERFRLCRYSKEGYFGPHCDAFYADHERSQSEGARRSFYTFMLYLNGPVQGGETRFLRQYRGKAELDDDSERVTQAVPPMPGQALVFTHHIVHEGARMAEGVEQLKYLMRSDLMYRRVSGGPRDELSAEGLAVYNQALEAEARGDVTEAAGLFRRAFKLEPRLEDFLSG